MKALTIDQLLEAYRETGNENFLNRATKLAIAACIAPKRISIRQSVHPWGSMKLTQATGKRYHYNGIIL